MVIDNKGKLPLHLVGQSASQKNRTKSDDIIKLLKSKMPEDDDQGDAPLWRVPRIGAMHRPQRLGRACWPRSLASVMMTNACVSLACAVPTAD